MDWERIAKDTYLDNVLLRSMLRRLEWAGIDGHGFICCVICGKRCADGHASDCALAALLKEDR